MLYQSVVPIRLGEVIQGSEHTAFDYALSIVSPIVFFQAPQTANKITSEISVHLCADRRQVCIIRLEDGDVISLSSDNGH